MRPSRGDAPLHPDVVTTLSKVGTQLRLLLSAKHAKLFAVTEDDYLVAYSVLDAGRVFAGARVESKSDNEIYLDTSFSLVASALASATSASYVTLKLIQRVGQAFLSFEVQNSGSGVVVVQDVPVTVLPSTDAALFTEPRIPPPDVSLLVRDTRRCVCLPRARSSCWYVSIAPFLSSPCAGVRPRAACVT